MKALVTPRSFGKNNPELFDRLKTAGLEVARNDTGAILSEAAIRERLADCEGVILGVDPLNANVLAAAPRLRAIAKYGVGLDNIDLDACKARGIAVSRTLHANSDAVADFAFALMLAVARRTAFIDRKCRRRDWSKVTSVDVYGKTLGIVGLGAVGRCVVKRAHGFAMRILAYDVRRDEIYARSAGVEYVDNVERICREADFISLHAALTEENRGMIHAGRLAMMKKTAVLVNTARGGLVDEAALLSVLRSGGIYGAGLDVFEAEPPEDEAWYRLDNLVMGSHTSSSTFGATELMGNMAVDNLLRDLGLGGR